MQVVVRAGSAPRRFSRARRVHAAYAEELPRAARGDTRPHTPGDCGAPGLGPEEVPPHTSERGALWPKPKPSTLIPKPRRGTSLVALPSSWQPAGGISLACRRCSRVAAPQTPPTRTAHNLKCLLIFVSARTNKRHHHLPRDLMCSDYRKTPRALTSENF